MTFERDQREPHTQSIHFDNVIITSSERKLQTDHNMLASLDIRPQITYFVREEERLLGQLLQLRKQSKDVSRRHAAEGVSKLAQAIVTDLFSSHFAGRFAKGLTQAYIRQNEQQTLATQERNLDSQHRYLVQSSIGLLGSVSIKRVSMKVPNSQSLVERVNNAQAPLQLETRMRRTITVLRSISGKSLIYNREIQPPAAKPRPQTVPKLTIRFPRISRILTEVVGLEPKLRNHVRQGMKSEYGDTWMEKVREKFGSASAKWEAIAKERGGRDLLDGTQFGDLLSVISQFEVLRKGALSSHQAQLALTIVAGERRLLVHPLSSFTEDIDERRYEITSMAILTLTSLT